eukprot:TRINITY_DN71065_c0_g1_i1.p1 TRINITY_DN71065_c0_g1~~TRINITY_DN71065_c0_g1_i1.p1  ORF type:complete len:220 (-),score=14.55 TRINITY_DN71065_c0_g1_i1:103-762(-)
MRTLVLFSLVLAVAFCELADKVEVYKETKPLEKLHGIPPQKICIKSGTAFIIDLPGVWSYPRSTWALYKISGEDNVICEKGNDKCPSGAGPIYRIMEKEKSEPAPMEVKGEKEARILPRYYGPRKKFTCRAEKPGKAVLTFYYMALGVLEPCLKYEVVVKVRGGIGHIKDVIKSKVSDFVDDYSHEHQHKHPEPFYQVKLMVLITREQTLFTLLIHIKS